MIKKKQKDRRDVPKTIAGRQKEGQKICQNEIMTNGINKILRAAKIRQKKNGRNKLNNMVKDLEEKNRKIKSKIVKLQFAWIHQLFNTKSWHKCPHVMRLFNATTQTRDVSLLGPSWPSAHVYLSLWLCWTTVLCSDIMALLYSPSFDFDIFYFYSQCLYENILFSVLSIHWMPMYVKWFYFSPNP